MTIHKGQGSEFDRILLVLFDRDISVMTRELIYTGITRARQNIEIWVSQDLLSKEILRKISCQSGLSDALRNFELTNVI
jgi:exodeoxyribonuclease V alpha subunit